MSEPTEAHPIGLLLSVLRLLGAWPKRSSSKEWRCLYSFVSLALFLAMLTQAVFGYLYALFVPIIMSELADVVCIPTALCVGMWSSANLLFGQSTLYNLLHRTQQDFPEHPVHLRLKWFKTTRVMCLTFLTIWPSWMFFYDVRPYLQISLQENNGTVPLENYLPSKNWYPFDVNHHPIFEVVFLYQCVGTFVSITVCGIFTAIFICLTMFSVQQFDILAESLRNIKSLVQLGDDQETHRIMENELQRCIEHHLVILRFVGDFNAFVSKWVLFYLLDLTFVITLVAYIASQGLGLNYNSGTMFSYVLITAIYMLMMGKAGSEIEARSTLIAEAAYDCGWEDASQSFRKSICILMMRSQRPCVLTAGKFYVVNQEAILSLLNMAFSYYMVLRNVADVD